MTRWKSGVKPPCLIFDFGPPCRSGLAVRCDAMRCGTLHSASVPVTYGARNYTQLHWQTGLWAGFTRAMQISYGRLEKPR